MSREAFPTSLDAIRRTIPSSRWFRENGIYDTRRARSLMDSRSAWCCYRFYIEPIILSAVLWAANNSHLRENNRLLGGNLRNWNLYNYIAIMRLLLPLCARGLSYHKMLHRISYLEYTFQLRNAITLYRNKNFPVPRKQSFSGVYLFFHAARNFPDNTISKRASVYLSSAFCVSSSSFFFLH